ncbi:uncharacterized protein LOC113783762 [Coffea eugenioides]|uniref:uncharacterized protein LOC113783762 n=1 Tax=Coffea eugenioides TaxID=49369 RepID=UPI000F60F428|nr:uncharacterized protein LOC113783762 [Coffea eugenioides]
MQSSSCLLCSSNFPFSPLPFPSPQQFALLSRNQPTKTVSPSPFPAKFPLSSLCVHQYIFPSLHCTVTQEVVETTPTESELVDIGYICSVHGLQGEVRVNPSTDFPDLRFSKPGRRWLRQQVSGREMMQEIQLVEGRGHPGQAWILKFNKIDSVDQALKLVGSTILISEEDRPELEEGEFYSHDLVGMKVILKDTEEPIGTVISVYNSGANDLLLVQLSSSVDISNQTGKPKQERGGSGPFVWIPFVEAIVPDVDVSKREMLITPPKGLLELNMRSDERSKKERRQLEWKERKKFQKRVIAAKKKLCELQQQHVFDGFRHVGKLQGRILADQIVTVNSKLLQQALRNIEMNTLSDMQIKSPLENLGKCFSAKIREQSDAYSKLQQKGLHLVSQGKVAVILLLEDSQEARSSNQSAVDSEGSEGMNCLLVEALMSDSQQLVKKSRPSVPLVVVCPAHSIGSLQELFSDYSHFDFDPDKVWFFEEEKLPVVGVPLEEPKKHKILMESPWEILQTPVGSGGVISFLSSNNLLNNLSTHDVDYIQVCNYRVRDSRRQTLLGLVDSRKANAGVEITEAMDQTERNLNMVFSMKFMKKLTKQTDNLHFEAVPKASAHTQKVDTEWVDVIPTSPNSLEFRCSIYSCLNSCPPSQVSVLEVTE